MNGVHKQDAEDGDAADEVEAGDAGGLADGAGVGG